MLVAIAREVRERGSNFPSQFSRGAVLFTASVDVSFRLIPAGDKPAEVVCHRDNANGGVTGRLGSSAVALFTERRPLSVVSRRLTRPLP